MLLLFYNCNNHRVFCGCQCKSNVLNSCRSLYSLHKKILFSYLSS